jgi:8-amino-7-oxononanoate synthase
VSARPDFAQALAHARAQRIEAMLARRLIAARRDRPARIRIDGVELIDFGSNDYLGLAQHPRLLAALRRASQAGARASHLLGGHQTVHQELERALADWLGYPRALLFSTGYMAATGTLSALLGRHDLCVQDRLNHACLLDGARLAGARLERYRHADAQAAAEVLTIHPTRRALIVTDSVFSMDGDLAPLAELAAVAQRERAWLMVDEAHGLGVLGPEGRGACAAAGLSAEAVPVWMGTLGKALGCFGAVIAGSDLVIDTLIDRARSFLYTTALPPALAEAALEAVALARAADAERAHLAALVARLRRGSEVLGLRLLPSATPIQPLVLGSAERALAWAEAVRAAGCYCPAVRPPTVPKASARLRISLSAAHTTEDVDRLLEALSHALARAG